MESRWSSHSVFNGRSQSPMQRGVSSGGGLCCLERGGDRKSLTGPWRVSGPQQPPSLTPPTPTPSPGAACQKLLMNLFSRQPCYLGLWFSVRECTQWDLKPNHLLHSPTPLPDSQPSPFTKHQFLGTLSQRYLPFGMVGVCLMGGWQWRLYLCLCIVCVCLCVHVRLSICPSRTEVICV